MKKKKHERSDSAAEAVVEVILTVVFFALGFFVCLGISAIFSVDMEHFDPDSMILIGIISLVVVIIVIYLVYKLLRRIKGKRK